MLRLIDSLLNKVTMYWLTLNVLRCFIAAATILSFFGFLHYNFIDILLDTFIAVQICWLSNIFLAKLFHAIPNKESAHITALILVLIIPPQFPVHILFLAIVSVVAMFSKYLLTIEKRHIFNPAAVAVVAISLLTSQSATWWIGTPTMLPVVVIGGLFIMRKIQRETMLFVFFLTYFVVTGVLTFLHGGVPTILSTWKAGVLDSALFFFGFIMLTEPVTSPATKTKRSWYAMITAIFFATPNLRLGIGLTPEIALCIGNIFSYIISPNYRLFLSLSWKKAFGNISVFAFTPPQQFLFLPGQYMEWTLLHKNVDSRGNRRYFSIASSPTEKELLLTVKFYEPSSSYKKQLSALQVGDSISAAQVMGDFTLPKKLDIPLVFIAGGVGIAPFRSMIQYIIDKNLQANIILLYANRTKEEIVFADIFQKAEANGIKTIYILTDTENMPQDWQGEKGYITGEMVKRAIPDYNTRTFYLSGPQLMVERYHETLTSIGVSRNHIKQDFFPGYSEK